MSEQNVSNYKTRNIDKTDKSLNTSEKSNQNDNSIVPSQLDIKISNNNTISESKIVYLKSCSMSKKKKNHNCFNYWRNYFNWNYSCNSFIFTSF